MKKNQIIGEIQMILIALSPTILNPKHRRNEEI